MKWRDNVPMILTKSEPLGGMCGFVWRCWLRDEVLPLLYDVRSGLDAIMMYLYCWNCMAANAKDELKIVSIYIHST